ncbi:M14 metallopeptidase family protein [Paraglaciecola hydrolytica]|uniref:Peptidase M14 n=1 Tax=Paraglaciecola hydrolytica TaxID=1799789 RepID=A0A136A4M6_9ALTE|nr:M14 metallopeptidase family protein [Paraglaciecola hydrolytica]KXI30156.1 peptidase M14 [Paraglaciecola hydrolytica]
MSRLFFTFALSLLLTSQTLFAVTDNDYLPANTQYNPTITSPTQSLGAEVGDWHVRHDQIVNYMRTLAAQSDRVSLLETGRSHENRPLLLLAFTSPANQNKLSELQAQHVANLGKPANDNDPLVLWMGYSVHGNESSGSNAALLVAYYLAAGQNAQIDALLKDNIVLLDPSINPDGLSRFAQWANMHKGQTLVADPMNREHQEAWPSGRTNHYWFDLNRDWLLLTHPESRARIAQYQKWRPHVLTDFHEMGSDSTFFFQPGVPERKNPWTPLKNVELTAALGDFHAKALDDTKQLYFTQEGYDDFYYGKGSTYPDAFGSIGILFEQASSRGHLRDTANGLLSFQQTIQNQVTTSLSTFAGALANKSALLNYQQEFAQQTEQLVKKDDLSGYLVQEALDDSRFARFQAILQAHKIEFFAPAKDIKVDDKNFVASNSIFVPLEQERYRLIKSLFSTRQSFDDNTFYDVSNWNLPLAFNLDYAPVEKKLWRKVAPEKQSSTSRADVKPQLIENAYAYAFTWDDSKAPTLLSRLLRAGVKVQLAGDALVAQTTQGSTSFGAGSVMIPTALKQPTKLLEILHQQSRDLPIAIHSLTSGLTRQGIDLGSNQMVNIELPKVLLVGGEGTSQYEAGEVWHHFDKELEMPLTIVDLDSLSSVKLENYSHIIWVEGNYKSVATKTVESIEKWLKQGGVLIGQQSAIKWFADNKWLKTQFKSDKDIALAFEIKGLQYSDMEAFKAKQRIAGAVFATQLDLSHPLAFGFHKSDLAVFRNNNQIMLKPEKPFITVASYTAKPLIAGYTAAELQELIGNSATVIAHTKGKGKIIAFNTDVNFRGVWQGTSRLMDNAIFMAAFINAGG